MTNPVFDNLMNCVGDTFRPERKEVEARALQASRYHEMIANGRYTAEQLNVDEAWFERAAKDFNWIEADGTRINQTYNIKTTTLYPWQRETRDWCLATLASLRNPNVVTFGEMLFSAALEGQRAVRP